MKKDNLERRTEEVRLIKLIDKPIYYGKYVAFNFEGGKKELIAYGKDVGKVIGKARKKGVEVPAIVYVFEPGVTYDLAAA